MRALVAGLGTMGLPMARALRHAGIEVSGFDVRPIDAADLAQVSHPRDAGADLLIIVVRDASEIDALCFDAQGLFTAPPWPSRVMLCSTVSVGTVHALAARLPDGVRLVDAPMSGAPVAAQERRLSFMLGGDPGDIDALQPALSAMGEHHFRAGPLGTGMRMKVLNNSVAAASVVAVRRALTDASRHGIESRHLLDVMRASSGATWFGDNLERIDWALEGYAPDNTIGILEKDVGAGIDSAERTADDWDRALLDALRAL